MKDKLLLITLVSALGRRSQMRYFQGSFDLQSYLIGSRKEWISNNPRRLMRKIMQIPIYRILIQLLNIHHLLIANWLILMSQVVG